MLRSIVICLAVFTSLVLTSKSEIDLSDFILCGRERFRCSDGERCIYLSQVCNNEVNCNDRSDEETCRCYTSPLCFGEPESTCSESEFRCNSGECIPYHWQCDGDYDCTDYSDEHAKCEKQPCTQYEFTCDNGACIDARLKCNSKNDCGDNSDETICQILPSNRNAPIANYTDCGNAFRCKDGTCIPFNQVCDAQKVLHCPDGSDEGGKCINECDECKYVSQKTPSGCICRCPAGNRLAGDGITCVDIPECNMDPPVCSQLCSEAEGSYSCKCFQEFDLRHDNKTCKSQGNGMSIYYAVRNELRQYIPARRNIRIIHVETAGNLTSVDMDITSGLIYYTAQNNESLHQLVVANASRKSITNVGSVTHLTVDWITQNVYFISKESAETNLVDKATEEPKTTQRTSDPENAVRLMMCNFGERHCATLKQLHVDVTALTIDAINKHLFYATTESSGNDGVTQKTAHLYSTGLDGQYTRRIATFNKTITDMSLDYRHKHLYVVEDTSIDRLDYDGGRMINMVEASMMIKGLNVYEDHLYFLTQDGLIMHKCRLFGEARRCSSFRLSAESTDMFFIAQSTRQTTGRNACLNYNCTHLCVPSETGAVCLCENGKLVDELSDCRD